MNQFETLQDARDHTVIEQRMVSNAMVFALLGQHNSMISLMNSTDNNNNAMAFITALTSSVDEYNLMTGHPVGDLQQAALAQLVSEGIITQAFSDAVIDYANNKVTKPYENLTLSEFNRAKGIFTELEVIGYTPGSNLSITLIDDLPEDCTITTWEKDGEFQYENFGKHCHVKVGQNTYKIKMNGKSVDGSLFVRIPFENFNYTVEVI